MVGFRPLGQAPSPKAIPLGSARLLVHQQAGIHGRGGGFPGGGRHRAAGPRTVHGFVGNGVPVLLQRVLRAVGETHDDDAVEALTPRFLGIYGAEPSSLSRLYPGVAEAPAALAAAAYRPE